MNYAIGVDIGGTKIAAGLIDEQGNLTCEIKCQSNAENRESLFEQVVECINYVLETSNLKVSELGLGIGIPGLVDRVNGIAVFQNNIAWENFPIVKRLRAYYPELQRIEIDNDVYQAAWAEWRHSKLTQGTLVYLTVSTGISCTIINNGNYIRGEGFAGELGLFPLALEPAKVTRLESVLGGNHLAQKAQTTIGLPTMSTKDLFESYYKGDTEAVTLINDWIEHLAIAIYQVGSLLDPTQIVLGGSIIRLNPKILPKLLEIISQLIVSPQSELLERIEISEFENNSGLIGAGLSGFGKD